MEAMKNILTRRSIRNYTSQKVTDSVMRDILAAAMQAPSAGNQQPWHFVLVTEQETLNRLAGVLDFGKMLVSAPLAVVVCADLKLEKYDGFWVQDCSAATQNLLLAAHALGLGSVWLGIHPVETRVKDVRGILGLPEHVIPFSIVSIGYPAAKAEPPSPRYDENRLHKNGW